jgi:hypothetical protein
MNVYEWIVCERRGQWAAAMRMAVARGPAEAPDAPRMYEVRSLDELNERLAVRPDSLALIELHAGNLPHVLNWASTRRKMHPNGRFIAFMDRALESEDAPGALPVNRRSRLVDMLLEAGAVEIVFSPRQVQRILPIAYRHAETWNTRRLARSTHESIEDWAWSLVPWQTQ